MDQRTMKMDTMVVVWAALHLRVPAASGQGLFCKATNGFLKYRAKYSYPLAPDDEAAPALQAAGNHQPRLLSLPFM